MTNQREQSPESYYASMEPIWSEKYPSINSIEEYDSFYQETAVGRSVSEIVIELMAHVPVERGRLLDFGCDNGIMLNFFGAYDLELYGIDINAAAISRGRVLYPHFDLRVNAGLLIPFTDDFFDVVLAAGVLKHIRYADRPQLYDEFERVARQVMVFEENAAESREEKMSGFTFYHTNFSKELGTRFHAAYEFKVGGNLFGVYDTATVSPLK